MPICLSHRNAIAFGCIGKKFRSEVRVARGLMEKSEFAVMRRILRVNGAPQFRAGNLFGDGKLLGLIVQQANTLSGDCEAHLKILAREPDRKSTRLNSSHSQIS